MYEENNPKRILILENNPQKSYISFYNCGYFFVNSRFNNTYSLKTYEMISVGFFIRNFFDHPPIEEGRRDC